MCDDGCTNTDVVIARGYLQHQLELITGIRVDRPIEFEFAMSTEEGLGVGFERLCQFLAERSESVVSLEHPMVAASMCETLARMLLLGQPHDHGYLLEQRHANIGAQEQRLLEEYIVANADRRIGLAELARLTGATGQVIDASFRDRRGLPLQAFIERTRLEHVHELLETTPELTPARALRRANVIFSEHFNAEYLRVFGELPEATWIRAQTEKVSATTRPATVFLIVGNVQLAQSLQLAVCDGGYLLETFDSVDAFINAKRSGRLGCVIIELALAGHRRLAEACPRLPWIGLSAEDTARVAVESMKEGALDVLFTPVEPTALWQGIELAFAHGAEQRRLHVTQAQQAARLASLTPREREVCERVARGALNKQIADELRISRATVKVHRARGLQKLGASSAAELARMLMAD
ncbi:Response regulator [Enhygromyxa salina]|uniref:Response regulator n=2 Tax=Enhygromyxa salina TaxID=215803 RepID=A0A0C2CZE3_9BACT|nr:Response regulator [Enhygromyxa salina]